MRPARAEETADIRDIHVAYVPARRVIANRPKVDHRRRRLRTAPPGCARGQACSGWLLVVRGPDVAPVRRDHEGPAARHGRSGPAGAAVHLDGDERACSRRRGRTPRRLSPLGGGATHRVDRYRTTRGNAHRVRGPRRRGAGQLVRQLGSGGVEQAERVRPNRRGREPGRVLVGARRSLIVHPNLAFQSWVRETFATTIPSTALEVVRHPASMDDDDSPDPFWKWVRASRR